MNFHLGVEKITSRQNSWYKNLRDWTHSSGVNKAEQLLWLEGDHLCEAANLKNFVFLTILLREDAPQALIDTWVGKAEKVVMVTASLMMGLSSLNSPPPLAAIVRLPNTPLFNPTISTVVLDQLQDPGNAGSILRSAAAFGFKQVVTTEKTVGLWTHKVVRSSMGAHFGLGLIEGIDPDLFRFSQLHLMLTSSHQGDFLHQLVANKKLPNPIAWIFGHEGRGHSEKWLELECQTVRIEQPGGEESLNVAAAAAICLHASTTQFT
jgi:TrmH family RNA methyltransferase